MDSAAQTLLLALLGGGLISAGADLLRARRDRKLAPAQQDSTIVTGAKDAVTAMREALATTEQRCDRIARDLGEVRAQLAEQRTFTHELESALQTSRQRVRELETQNATLRERVEELERRQGGTTLGT